MNLLAAELRRIQRWCDLAANETRLTLIDGEPADAWDLRQALPTADNGPAGECSGPRTAADGPGRSTTTPPVVPAGTENATPRTNPQETTP